MDKRTLERQIDTAARRYGGTRDPAVATEINKLSQRLLEFRILATLDDALERCRSDDMCTPEVQTALSELAKVIPEPWPTRHFTDALANDNEEGRWQLANAALNRIRIL